MTSPRRHILVLASLLGLSCLVQAVVISRATVPGLDAVRFVETARRIDREGLVATARAQREQPLFPAWIWVVHEGMEHVGGQSRSAWATSAQLAAAIPLVAAVVPLYFLLLRLAGFAAAVAGSFFFCLLPEVSRLGADGISDSTHLLFFCTAFWAMVEYLARISHVGWDKVAETPVGRRKLHGREWWLLLAGTATAMAVLARAEVLVLAAALGVTLLAFQLQSGRRQEWKGLGAAAGCFVLGLAAVLGPYLAAVGSLTPRAAMARVLGRAEVELPEQECPSGSRMHAEAALVVAEGSFAAKDPSVSLRRRGLSAAIVRFARKLADAFAYWIGALALLGAWWMRRNPARAGDRFVQVFFVLFSLVAIWHGASEGYLGSRHLLTLVVAGLAAAGFGAMELARISHVGWDKVAETLVAPDRARPVIAWAVVALAGVACLPQTFARLHHNQAGHRAAAEWLARRADVPSHLKDTSHLKDNWAVLDTRGWTGLYSGRATYPYEEAPAVLGNPRLAYVVVERREFEYGSARSRTLHRLVETAGQCVGEFPDPAVRRPNQQPVLVYRWDPDRFEIALHRQGGTIRR